MATDPCADTCLPQIDQVQLGEIYDLFNTKVRADLQDDYDCKKINGATYADTWAKIMGPAIGTILGSVVSIASKETAKDRCVKDAQCLELTAKANNIDAVTAEITVESGRKTSLNDAKVALTNAQEEKADFETSNLLPSQEALYIRQAKGFDDNANQKLFESQMNGWAMVFADTDLTQVTSPLQDTHICDSFKRIKVGLGDAPGDCEPITP